MNDEFPAGVALHQAGRIADAEAVYVRLLAREPGHAGAMHLMGVIACQRGDFRVAVERIRAALAKEPGNFEMLLNLGEALRRGGDLREAAVVLRRAVAIAPQNALGHYNLALALAAAGERAAAIAGYEAALAVAPAFPEALNNLGLLLAASGEQARAAEAFEKAIALRPAHVEAWNNAGLSWWELGRHEESLRAFERAVALRPDFAPAHANAAFALRRLGKRAEAVAAFERAVAVNPAGVEVWRDLGMALLEVGRVPDGVLACRRAVELSPANAEALHALGVALSTAGDEAGAVEACERAMAIRPGMKEWEFELAALKGEQPGNAPDAYVRVLFDEYALRFERHLVDELKYRVPWDLLQAVGELSARGVTMGVPWDVLDLGCGTGVVGELFRPSARRVVGCDLSGKMCDIARQRRVDGTKVYDEVICGHIVPVMRERPAEFNVILAADVFIYVGALEEVFAAAAASLCPGGVIAFSVEQWEGEGFGLGSQRRFGHSRDYLQKVGTSVGLREVLAERVQLRVDVPSGWIIVLQKSATSA